MTLWKINSCWPSVEWQVFDWYLKPMVSWFYLKKAGEPLHVQLNLPDRMVSVINTRPVPQSNLEVRARVFDLNATLLWEKTAKASVPANTYGETFTVPELPGTTPVYFVKLELKDAQGRLVSDNFYWLRANRTEDLRALQTLPPVKLKSSCRIETRGSEKLAHVKVNNPTSHIAFFVQLALARGRGGAEILPIFWDDNYFSLLPGESRELTARLASADVMGTEPILEVGGWNIESNFKCLSAEVSPLLTKAGQPCAVNVRVSDTFLDGARVFVRCDGKPVASSFAFARGGQSQSLAIPLKIDAAGKHELSIGNRKLQVTVAP